MRSGLAPDDRDVWKLVAQGLDDAARELFSTDNFSACEFDVQHQICQRFSDGDTLDFEHLEASAGDRSPAPVRADDWFNPDFAFPAEGFLIEEAINRLIQHALKQTGQNVSAAARLLGVSRDYLRYRLFGKQSGKTGD